MGLHRNLIGNQWEYRGPLLCVIHSLVDPLCGDPGICNLTSHCKDKETEAQNVTCSASPLFTGRARVESRLLVSQRSSFSSVPYLMILLLLSSPPTCVQFTPCLILHYKHTIFLPSPYSQIHKARRDGCKFWRQWYAFKEYFTTNQLCVSLCEWIQLQVREKQIKRM